MFVLDLPVAPMYIFIGIMISSTTAETTIPADPFPADPMFNTETTIAPTVQTVPVDPIINSETTTTTPLETVPEDPIINAETTTTTPVETVPVDPIINSETTTTTPVDTVPEDPIINSETTTTTPVETVPVDPIINSETTTTTPLETVPEDPIINSETTITTPVETVPVADSTTASGTTVPPVDGEWGDWSTWTTCNAYCGTGKKYRSRACDNPEPSNGGQDCAGSTEESADCVNGECCAPRVFDMALMVDLSLDPMTEITTFVKSVANVTTIAPSRTRISMATLSSSVKLKFDFVTYTSYADVSDGISLSNTYGRPNLKEALDYARGTMFTTENGDRSDVSDVLIMVISDSVDDEEVDIAAQSLKDNGVYLIVAEETRTSSSSTSVVEPVSDLYASFTKSWSSYKLTSALNAIENGFPCNYFCATSFFALDSPSTLSTGNDSSSGYLYIMTDSPFKATCCGATSAWEFFAVNYGTVEMMIFRQASLNDYYLVGSTTVIVPEKYVNTTISFSLTSSERIAIVEGDMLAWYTNGPNMIGHADCTITSRSDCPQNNKRLYQPGAKFNAGDSIDFSSAETIANKGFSIKVATTNNTELTLITIQNETEIEESTPIGTKVLYFRVEDTDLNDNITFTLSGDSELFIISEVQFEKVTLNLNSTVPRNGGPYIITVTGTDSCQHTASATVTVSTYNAPPIINNLPSILEISESTTSSIFLYTINVTDATNDEICCTLAYTLPVSHNFNFTKDDGVYSIWTVEEPAFAYNDIDSYRIFICCQDDLGSSTSYLILRLTEVAETKQYIPPDWFYRAIIISLLPISFMTILSVATLVITMFFLDGDIIVPERTETAVLISREPTLVSDDDDATILSEIENTLIKPVSRSIEFKDLYKNEVVQIPVWTGKFRKAPQETAQNAWREISNIDIEEQSNLPSGPRTKGDAFGVQLKLFHFGKKPMNSLSAEEKATQMLQKKNALKEKWKEIIAKAESDKKKKEIKKKTENHDLSPAVDKQNSLIQSRSNSINIAEEKGKSQNRSSSKNTSEENRISPLKKKASTTVINESNYDIIAEKMYESNETESLVLNIDTQSSDSAADNTDTIGDENSSVANMDVMKDESENLSVFNEIVETGTAAIVTDMKK
ncbi:uncharacterized protein LOC127708599 isoform X3 [Mytilus californianus]|uniref:uncharacterized protein LOC127708599 isoform X3 n=1 Tax=Mytilus californianus TaxID=6549 RepID=UPI00224523EC|nr:uncharacterized protein LOC127708599 isoform X3 [Mytilus californianus]